MYGSTETSVQYHIAILSILKRCFIILQVASSGSSGSSVSVELDSGPYNLRKLNNYILEVIRWVPVSVADP
jgi:hypothetical protein